MSGKEYIKLKQKMWAKKNNISLLQAPEGYVENLNDNLFEPLLVDVKNAFDNGNGGELKSIGNRPPKMKALHSSSAIGVNFFQYWLNKGETEKIAVALGLCKEKDRNMTLSFEEKFQIFSDSNPANLDVFINDKEDDKYNYAIECKFSEAYSGNKKVGLSEKYNDLPEWKFLINLEDYSKTKLLSCKYLDAGQLIKHTLGLKKAFGSNFTLVYLWYDVLGDEGAQHRHEIEEFTETIKKDSIRFISMSYQELIKNICKKFYIGNEEYCHYISNRYL